MVTQVDEVVTDGIVTRDELLGMGCEEVKSRRGRRGYVIGEEVIGAECTKCGEVKQRGSFNRRKSGFMGIQADCKRCVAVYKGKYLANNRDKIAEYRAEYYANNRDKIAKYYANNREKILGYGAEYYANNREYHEEYYTNNREKILKYRSEYYADNQEKMAKYHKEYYDNNRDKIAEYGAEYRANNPEKESARRHRRRARVNALPDNLTHEQLTEINATFYNTCTLSGEPTDLHADHVLPIAIGHGGTTYGNMIPLSAELNMSKSDAHLYEWFSANAERFGLSQRKFDKLTAYLSEANEMTPAEYRKYVDWCFDNPRTIDEATGELVFKDGPINGRTNERKAIA